MPSREAEVDGCRSGRSDFPHRAERDGVTKAYSHLRLACEEQGINCLPTREQICALGNRLGLMLWSGLRPPFVHQFARSSMEELASDTILEQAAPQPSPRSRERSRDILPVDSSGSAQQRRPCLGRKMILCSRSRTAIKGSAT